ncbi:DUF4148 domain-containing protein [Paraburkholderia kirstenboschensis]|uniref:DUF4148 domain-containing protein n=1 Tax=Paraburkholderia kirstenboschensis TaxID=1245436 RepID=UPI000FFBE565
MHLRAAALALLASSPVASFAQTGAPVTRSQVRAELADLERAGYNPVPDDVDYPARLNVLFNAIECAETRSIWSTTAHRPCRRLRVEWRVARTQDSVVVG